MGIPETFRVLSLQQWNKQITLIRIPDQMYHVKGYHFSHPSKNVASQACLAVPLSLQNELICIISELRAADAGGHYLATPKI